MPLTHKPFSHYFALPLCLAVVLLTAGILFAPGAFAGALGFKPELVLGLVEVESGFKKYAVSGAGAHGYMQVMPFWVKEIGAAEHNLFHLRINLRYGCTILRYYLDIEKGDLYRALGRYNGSLGRPEYPNLVRAAWHSNWSFPRRTADSGHRPADG